MVRSQWVLAAAGMLLFAIGAGLGVLTLQLVQPHAELEAGESPVGREECVSCHTLDYRAVERAVQPMAIQHRAAKSPAVALVAVRAEGLPVIPMANATRPYALTSADANVAQPAPRWLVRTDAGTTVLPEVWTAMAGMTEAAGEWCDACHAPTPTVSAPGGL